MYFLVTILGRRGEADYHKRLTLVALDNEHQFFSKELGRRTPYALTVNNCDAAGEQLHGDPVLIDLDGEIRFRQPWHEPPTSVPQDILDAVQARMLCRYDDPKGTIRIEPRA